MCTAKNGGITEDPEAEVNAGPLTVTMTWGASPDLDLHILEPNGFGVKWDSLNGISDRIDRDDVSGFGPEHYAVDSCDDLETGLYRVGVNYIVGIELADDVYEPETAEFVIRAGNYSYVCYWPLTWPSGSTGFSGTQSVVDILVDDDGIGGYQMTILNPFDCIWTE